MPKSAGVAVASIGLALWAALPAAQQPTPAQARTVFRSGVEYVAVDVIVTDKNDKPVTDLTVNDFEIREAGRKQDIRDFDHVSVPVSRRKVDLKAVPPPAPDVATNPLPKRTGRAFVFVIDDGAIRIEDIVPLKRAMTEFLQTLSPDDQAAVVYIKRSDLAQDFTSDVGLLVRGVNNINAAIGWGPDARATRLVLNNVIGTLASSPETRRAIVYVSSGFQICRDINLKCSDLDHLDDPSKFTFPGLQDLFGRAKIADVPIYTIDPHGLAAPELGLSGAMENQTPQFRASLDVATRQRQELTRTLAENTGGLAFVNSSSLTSAANAVMADNASYYVLGYSPSPYLADGEFHKLEVKVTTRPGLRVRARAGYLASAKPAATSDPHSRLTDALGDGQPHADLALRAFAAPVAAAANGATTIVTLDVSYPAAVGDQPRSDDDLQVEFVAIDSDGAIKRTESRAIHVPLAAARRDAFTLSLDDAFDLPRGKATLRIGVSSQVLGTVGTVHLPVEVRGLNGSAFEASPLVLGVTGGVPDLVARPETISTLVPLQPTTRREFSRDQQLRIFSRVFAPVPEDVKADIRLMRGDKVVRTIPVRMSATPSAPRARDCDATLVLKDLAADTYVVEFTANLGKLTATRAVAFRVQ